MAQIRLAHYFYTSFLRVVWVRRLYLSSNISDEKCTHSWIYFGKSRARAYTEIGKITENPWKSLSSSRYTHTNVCIAYTDFRGVHIHPNIIHINRLYFSFMCRSNWPYVKGESNAKFQFHSLLYREHSIYTIARIIPESWLKMLSQPCSLMYSRFMRCEWKIYIYITMATYKNIHIIRVNSKRIYESRKIG